jgi:outer membrane protein OmpA-like peptidoglycan-associated protein
MMNYLARRRYTARYGSRRAATLRWVLAAALLGAGLAGLTRARTHAAAPADFIITATATASEPAPALPADIVQMLRSAGLGKTPAAAHVVAPGASQPDTISLTPHLPNGQVDYGPTRNSTMTANISAVQQAVEREAAQGPFDLLATLAAAIKAAPAPATLIVVSSGLSTSGGFDLRQVGWDASPSTVAAQLKARGLLPDLAGYQVLFAGLGDTAGRQRPLPLPQQTTLARYWEAICQASGAASCSVDDTGRPEPPSHSTIPVPLVPVPGVTSVTGPRHSTITLPDTLLFPYGSSTLVPSADTILQPIAQRARSQHQLVSITGYASPDGGSHAYNLTLSARRANAVRNRLLALGLPAGQAGQVTGAGTAGKSRDACLIHGQTDEATCAHLRKVVIILSPAAATT